MNLFDYFDPTFITPVANGLEKKDSIMSKLQFEIAQKLKIHKNSLVIIGVNENRNSNNPGASESADQIRKYLYSLSGSIVKYPLIDLGNLKKTPSPNNTYIALQDVVKFIVSQGASCIVIGGTQELTWPTYLGVSEQTKPINVTIIDQTIDMGCDDGDFSSNCYMERFLKEPQENLFNLSLMGYQGYVTNTNHINAFQKKHAELIRLGTVRSAIEEVEPIFRDSNIVSFDMGCVRQGDSPGSVNPSPNGLYAEEFCQLTRYAGRSHRIKAFGIFDYNTKNDPLGQSAHLAAQGIWHFIEAFNSSSRNLSLTDPKNYKRFYVKSPIPDIELVFLHNTVDETWWIELPASNKTPNKPLVIACSYNDYLMASKGEVPDRWIRNSRKMT
jgi:arginase family enzyme